MKKYWNEPSFQLKDMERKLEQPQEIRYCEFEESI